ncbi:MAG TPA: hypothetical protein VK158_03205 [Acidobacteriota bacterium]|nr:hypothetical protein [Acidobacteriota bacterium]
MRKAQVLTEFMVYFGVALILFSGIIIFVLSEQTQSIQEQEESAIESFAISLQNDFMVASTMKEGFSRQIELDPTINGNPYTFEILASNMYITQGENQVVLALPSVTGNTTSFNFTLAMLNGGLTIQ